MAMKNFTIETDADGIALVTWTMDDKSMNVIDQSVIDDLDVLIASVEEDADIKGVILTSTGNAFCAGADLTMLEGLLKRFHAEKDTDREAATARIWKEAARLSRMTRRIETCGKPWIAAINGLALGGGFEIALACHARIAADHEKTRIGLPEVRVGLLPGSGGTQRLPRMIDPQAAMEMLLQGKLHDLSRAKALGLVDAVVPAKKLIAEARKALIGLSPKKPWDVDKFRAPIRVYSPAGMQLFPAANAITRRETAMNYPAAQSILSCVYEGLQMPMDIGLKIESRYFAHVLQTRQAEVMIRSLFVSKSELEKGARRPADAAPSKIRKVGVLGAGFMGAGIAYVTAAAGIKVVLIDRDLETAEKGKGYSEGIVKKGIQRRKTTEAAGRKLLGLIEPATDYARLSDCDLVIEAVFEDRDLKAKVTAGAEANMKRGAIFGSNTSTLPITDLAKASKKPRNFIGIHFFSPVDKMMLVEIITGRRTSDAAVARALDYCRMIRKTPIVVNDTRGFYANRCVGNYLLEAHKMVMEGVPPAMVENAAKMAGMPVGPLALTDEVALDLVWKILQATRKDLGEKAIDSQQEILLEEMVVRRERLGRKNERGFYDYRGRDKTLWPGLPEIVEPKAADTFDFEELKNRLLCTQALEAARCFGEGVVTDVREADVGSILGFGFAPWSGGTLSYIDGIGTAAFVDTCAKLARKHGRRFRVPRLLREMAENGDTFYGRFPPGGALADAA